MPLEFRSISFEPGAAIPPRHTADGLNLSPALRWRQVPASTRELALIVDDPDAPGTRPWIHWLAYGISPSSKQLPEGVPPLRISTTTSGIVQGLNSWGCIGYRGPAPPPGDAPHRYRFVLYALDTALHLDPGIDAAALRDAMEGHVLESSVLTATYSR